MRFTLSLISATLLATIVSAAPASVAEDVSVMGFEEASASVVAESGFDAALARLRNEMNLEASASVAGEASLAEFAADAQSLAPENFLQKRYEDDDDDEDDDDEDDDDDDEDWDKDDDDEDDDDEDDDDEDDKEEGHGDKEWKKKKIYIYQTVTAEPVPTITLTTTTGTQTIHTTSEVEEVVTETTQVTRLLSLPFLTVV